MKSEIGIRVFCMKKKKPYSVVVANLRLVRFQEGRGEGGHKEGRGRGKVEK